MNFWMKYLSDPRMFEAPGEPTGGTGGGDPDTGANPGTGGDPDTGAGGGEGDNPFKWFGSDVDDDTKHYLESKGFTEPAHIYKSLRSAEKLIRGDQVAGPPEDPEKYGDWLKETGLNKRLGIPAEAKDYGIEKPEFDEGVADLIGYDDARHDRVLGKFHEANFTPAQVKAAMAVYAEEVAADAQAMATEAAADEEAMKRDLGKEWGENYETNVAAAIEVAAEVGLDQAAIENLRLGKVAGSTALTKILYELAVVRGNDTLKGGAGPGGGGVDQATAKREFEEYSQKHGAVLMNKDHPEHAEKFSRYKELKTRAGIGSGAR